jgi:hypothetical protein
VQAGAGAARSFRRTSVNESATVDELSTRLSEVGPDCVHVWPSGVTIVAL